jgi:hypothetical protein
MRDTRANQALCQLGMEAIRNREDETESTVTPTAWRCHQKRNSRARQTRARLAIRNIA